MDVWPPPHITSLGDATDGRVDSLDLLHTRDQSASTSRLSMNQGGRCASTTSESGEEVLQRGGVGHEFGESSMISGAESRRHTFSSQPPPPILIHTTTTAASTHDVRIESQIHTSSSTPGQGQAPPIMLPNMEDGISTTPLQPKPLRHLVYEGDDRPPRDKVAEENEAIRVEEVGGAPRPERRRGGIPLSPLRSAYVLKEVEETHTPNSHIGSNAVSSFDVHLTPMKMSQSQLKVNVDELGGFQPTAAATSSPISTTSLSSRPIFSPEGYQQNVTDISAVRTRSPGLSPSLAQEFQFDAFAGGSGGGGVGGVPRRASLRRSLSEMHLEVQRKGHISQSNQDAKKKTDSSSIHLPPVVDPSASRDGVTHTDRNGSGGGGSSTASDDILDVLVPIDLHVPKIRFTIFTMIQMVLLSIYWAIFLFGLASILIVYDRLCEHFATEVWISLFLVLPIAAFSFVVLSTVFTIMGKRVIIGKFQEGVYPMYGRMHLRWWCVERLNKFHHDLCFWAFQGTPVYLLYLTAMGVRVHPTAIIDTCGLMDFDLITIGPHAVLSNRSVVQAHTFRFGYLILAKVKIGHHALIAERAITQIQPIFEVRENVSTTGVEAGSDPNSTPKSVSVSPDLEAQVEPSPSPPLSSIDHPTIPIGQTTHLISYGGVTIDPNTVLFAGNAAAEPLSVSSSEGVVSSPSDLPSLPLDIQLGWTILHYMVLCIFITAASTCAFEVIVRVGGSDGFGIISEKMMVAMLRWRGPMDSYCTATSSSPFSSGSAELTAFELSCGTTISILVRGAFTLSLLFGAHWCLPFLVWALYVTRLGPGSLNIINRDYVWEDLSNMLVAQRILPPALVAALAYLVFVLSFALIIILFKHLRISRHRANSLVQPNSWTHAVHLCFCSLLRKWVNSVGFMYIGTPMMPFFYRLLGARIGERVVMMRTEPWYQPDLISLGDDTFVGDYSLITACEYDPANGTQRLLPVVTGAETLIGMNAVLHAGSTVPRGCLVGAGTVLTPEMQFRMQESAQEVRTIFGERLIVKKTTPTATGPTKPLVQPSKKEIQKQSSATASSSSSSTIAVPKKEEAPIASYNSRWEAFHGWVTVCLISPALLTIMFLSLFPAACASVYFLHTASSWFSAGLLNIVSYWIYVLAPCLTLTVFKWLLLGAFKDPFTSPISSLFFYRRLWFTHFESFVEVVAWHWWSGMPLYNLHLNSMGSKLALSAHICCTTILEPDLVEIDAQTNVSEGALLFAHAVENKKLKMQKVCIGRRCNLDLHTITLFGCHLGDWTHLQQESVAAKGNALGDATKKEVKKKDKKVIAETTSPKSDPNVCNSPSSNLGGSGGGGMIWEANLSRRRMPSSPAGAAAHTKHLSVGADFFRSYSPMSLPKRVTSPATLPRNQSFKRLDQEGNLELQVMIPPETPTTGMMNTIPTPLHRSSTPFRSNLGGGSSTKLLQLERTNSPSPSPSRTTSPQKQLLGFIYAGVPAMPAFTLPQPLAPNHTNIV